MSISRRHLVRGAVGASLAAISMLRAGPARAIGPRSAVGIGMVKHGAGADHRPEAARRVLWECAKRTSIETARDATVVDLEGSDDALFWQPLLLTGTGAAPAFSDAARARLLRHLRFGGMLVVDSAGPDDPFARAARTFVAGLVPGAALARLPTDHVVYKSFFLVERAVGRIVAEPRLDGVTIDGRLAVVVSDNDLLGALERERLGGWRFECTPGGETQREHATRLAVNLVMYATCLDYKDDQVHIPFLMKKRRR